LLPLLRDISPRRERAVVFAPEGSEQVGASRAGGSRSIAGEHRKRARRIVGVGRNGHLWIERPRTVDSAVGDYEFDGPRPAVRRQQISHREQHGKGREQSVATLEQTLPIVSEEWKASVCRLNCREQCKPSVNGQCDIVHMDGRRLAKEHVVSPSYSQLGWSRPWRHRHVYLARFGLHGLELPYTRCLIP
jgi:hypothetical protein